MRRRSSILVNRQEFRAAREVVGLLATREGEVVTAAVDPQAAELIVDADARPRVGACARALEERRTSHHSCVDLHAVYRAENGLLGRRGVRGQIPGSLICQHHNL
jgi:hypothetical protein